MKATDAVLAFLIFLAMYALMAADAAVRLTGANRMPATLRSVVWDEEVRGPRRWATLLVDLLWCGVTEGFVLQQAVIQADLVVRMILLGQVAGALGWTALLTRWYRRPNE